MEGSTFEEAYPTFYFHKVEIASALHMENIRRKYIALGKEIHSKVPKSRSRSIALTHLEESLMRTIQAIAIDKGTIVIP